MQRQHCQQQAKEALQKFSQIDGSAVRLFDFVFSFRMQTLPVTNLTFAVCFFTFSQTAPQPPLSSLCPVACSGEGSYDSRYECRPHSDHIIHPIVHPARLTYDCHSAPMTTDSGTTTGATRPIPVAILGCTGVVGQKFIALLQGHPYFRIVSLCASERSAGRVYGSAVSWKLATQLPEAAAQLTVTTCDVQSVQQTGAEVVFSALDASVAGH